MAVGISNLPTDHPRSRGVYFSDGEIASTPSGSSPLARGLPRDAISDIAVLGIIPARAGFTHSIAYQYQAAEDHPRSRGVYGQQVQGRDSPAGSSPLARGLRLLTIEARQHCGIIPARAGFTTTGGRCRRWRQDHPRSRGVYHFPSPFCVGPAGSSPLARGLRRQQHRRRRGRRIIPARAGFTHSACRAGRPTGDHPRSRGVYAENLRARAGDGGSSPLARGLRQVVESPLPPARIIPARAGFTADHVGSVG